MNTRTPPHPAHPANPIARLRFPLRPALTAALAAFAVLVAAPATARAKDENGLRIEVQKSVISRDDERDGLSSYDDRVDRKLGLKIHARNISMRPFEEGEIEWTIIVERWGHSPRRFERYSGREKLPALKQGESVSLSVGESQVGGYKRYGGRYQDSLEAWQIVARHGGNVTLTCTSGSDFDAKNKRATAAEPAATGD